MNQLRDIVCTLYMPSWNYLRFMPLFVHSIGSFSNFGLSKGLFKGGKSFSTILSLLMSIGDGLWLLEALIESLSLLDRPEKFVNCYINPSFQKRTRSTQPILSKLKTTFLYRSESTWEHREVGHLQHPLSSSQRNSYVNLFEWNKNKKKN